MILVTGGLGFIGPHAARALLDAGESCVLTARQNTRVPAFLACELGERVFVEQLDLADREHLLALGKRYPIKGIVHLAAAPFAGDEPLMYLRRSLGTLFGVLEAARRWQVARVCLASTIGVYAGARPQPGHVNEDLPVPLTAGAALPIATIKRSGELIAGFVGAHSELELVSMRFSAIWGPLGRAQSPFSVAPALIHAAARGIQLELSPHQQNGYADNGADLCYVKDCARAVALLQTTDSLAHTTYNVAAGATTSNRELLAAIAELVPNANLTLSQGRDPKGPGCDTYLAIDRLHEDTGYRPEYTTPVAVADYLDWLRAGNHR